MTLKEDLATQSTALLQRRLNRLKSRKFVLFPWLRLKWLMRKYHVMQGYLGA